MPALGKETERQLTPDEIALQEVQGYMDKVEKQTETQKPRVNMPQVVQPQTTVNSQSTSKNISGMPGQDTKQKITLPMDRNEVETGLKSGIFDGLRWLSEWCVMMIKKYPGRVFYLPPNNTNK